MQFHLQMQLAAAFGRGHRGRARGAPVPSVNLVVRDRPARDSETLACTISLFDLFPLRSVARYGSRLLSWNNIGAQTFA